MVTEQEMTVTEEEKVEKARQLLEKKYPKKTGHVRRIHHLFDLFFRINIHDEWNDNKIVESHFVSVAGEEIKERK